MEPKAAAVNGIDIAIPFSHVPNALLFADGITLADVRVWAALKAYHFQKVRFTPAGFIAAACGRSQAAVWRSIRKLQDLGWIVKRSASPGRASTYRTVDNPGVDEVDPSQKRETPSLKNERPPLSSMRDDRERRIEKPRERGRASAATMKGARRSPPSAGAEDGPRVVDPAGPSTPPAGAGEAPAGPGLARGGVENFTPPSAADINQQLRQMQWSAPATYAEAYRETLRYLNSERPKLAKHMREEDPTTWGFHWPKALEWSLTGGTVGA